MNSDEMAYCVSTLCWSILLSFITSVGALSVSVTQTVHQGETGGAVTLEWLLTSTKDISPESVSFHCACIRPKSKRTFGVNDKYVKYPEHQDEHYRDRVRWEREALQNGSLVFHLSNLTIQDSGKYHCIVAVGDEERDQTTLLKVTDLDPHAQQPINERFSQDLVPPAPDLQSQSRRWDGLLGSLILFVLVVFVAVHMVSSPTSKK